MARVYIDNKYHGDTDGFDELRHGRWIYLAWPEHKSYNVIIAAEVALESIANHKFKCYFSIRDVMQIRGRSMALLAAIATAYVPKEIQLAEMLLT